MYGKTLVFVFNPEILHKVYWPIHKKRISKYMIFIRQSQGVWYRMSKIICKDYPFLPLLQEEKNGQIHLQVVICKPESKYLNRDERSSDNNCNFGQRIENHAV